MKRTGAAKTRQAATVEAIVPASLALYNYDDIVYNNHGPFEAVL